MQFPLADVVAMPSGTKASTSITMPRVCGCSNGAMSKRLNDLGDVNSRDRSKPGYGLLEGRAPSNGSAVHDHPAVGDGAKVGGANCGDGGGGNMMLSGRSRDNKSGAYEPIVYDPRFIGTSLHNGQTIVACSECHNSAIPFAARTFLTASRLLNFVWQISYGVDCLLLGHRVRQSTADRSPIPILGLQLRTSLARARMWRGADQARHYTRGKNQAPTHRAQLQAANGAAK
jgi:hypothetical protein